MQILLGNTKVLSPETDSTMKSEVQASAFQSLVTEWNWVQEAACLPSFARNSDLQRCLKTPASLTEDSVYLYLK